MDQSNKKTPYPSEAMSEADKARWDRADALRVDPRLPPEDKRDVVRTMQILAVRYRDKPGVVAKNEMAAEKSRMAAGIAMLGELGFILLGGRTDHADELTSWGKWQAAEQTVLRYRKEPLPPYLTAWLSNVLGLTFLDMFIEGKGSSTEIASAVLLLTIAGAGYGIGRRMDFDKAVRLEFELMLADENQI